MDFFFISATLVITAIATLIPGIILVLKRNALIIDGMSHAVLLGIVVFLIFTQDINSPLLIIGGSLSAVLMIVIVELINRTKLIPYDAAIGLVFPALFSLSVLLINIYLKNVHFHKESILMGEVAYLPFDQLNFRGISIGPKAMYLVGIIAIVNISFFMLFKKELQISIFDPIGAKSMGFMPTILHYIVMIIAAFTVMVSFRVVGAILVVGFLVVPAISGYLLTRTLMSLFVTSLVLTICSSLLGTGLATVLNWSIIGTVSMTMGVFFFIIYIFAPEKGILTQYKKKQNKKIFYSQRILLRHLYHHHDSQEEEEECSVDSFYYHINWNKNFAKKILQQNIEARWVIVDQKIIKLTDVGKKIAIEI